MLILAAVWSAACGPERPLPDRGSEAYREAVSAFYSGLAAMEVGADAHAESRLRRVTELASGEPAAWANLGLHALRRNEFDAAEERLNRAAVLAPESASIELLLGLLESERGRPDSALAHLRRAVELDSTQVRAMFAMARELERRGEDDEDEIGRWLDRILRLDPGNHAVLVERARLAARRGDADALREPIARLAELEGGWPDEARARLDSLEAAASRSDLRAAARQVAFLRNVLVALPAYRRDLAVVQEPDEGVGEPIPRFLRLEMPRPRIASADDSLRFEAETVAEAPAAWAGAPHLDPDAGPAMMSADGRELRLPDGASLPFPGGTESLGPRSDGVLAADYDGDLLIDLAMAGAGGFRLYRRTADRGFDDVTERLGLDPAVTDAAYTSVHAADVDMDGDLDLVLASADRALRLLRNNGDGTFVARPFLDGVRGLRGFVWTDLEGDGDPDAALVDGAGTLRIFGNERQDGFVERSLPGPTDGIAAIAAADLDGDGRIDVVALEAGGAVARISYRPVTRDWTRSEVVRWSEAPTDGPRTAGRLFLADLDNNGGLDLVASASGSTRVWLRDREDGFWPVPGALDGRILDVEDLDGDGRLDLVGLGPGSRPTAWRNRGARTYHWTRLRPRAAAVAGDQRINSFGIGGEVELRSGLMYQKQPITEPVVHFGLGERGTAEIARIVWPNGVVQAEFDLATEETVLATQRLKGSCPWVFAWDGTGMRFVTDFIWRSPLGMRINAQETAGAVSTEDRIRIPGAALVPRGGHYEIRITAELWETHFFDHISLIAVDHPEGSEVFVDERFAVPSPPLAARVMGPLRAIAEARDHEGRDVTEVVAELDERYLGTFGPGTHQGVTREHHHVEVELGPEAPTRGPLWLVASGWVRPTDSSINVALSQGTLPSPKGLALEVADGRGGWTVVREGLGFPAGKTKTVLIDLENVFLPDAPKRLRLRTNLEVYWDRIAWAVGRPGTEARERRVGPAVAELRYRGYSGVREADRTAPELPVYERLAGTAPRWRDLVGYYTRYGDVRELLEEVDDRYVIMNAGDELVLRFPALPDPPPGRMRDFVLVGDGWVKDGDYNTAFSRTVRPLPSHGDADYEGPLVPLREDPVYRRHAADWERYHTRYVGPERLQDALILRVSEAGR